MFCYSWESDADRVNINSVDAKAAVQKYRDLLKLYTAIQYGRAIYFVLGLEVQAIWTGWKGKNISGM